MLLYLKKDGIIKYYISIIFYVNVSVVLYIYILYKSYLISWILSL